MSLETENLKLLQRYHTALYQIERVAGVGYLPPETTIEDRTRVIVEAINKLKKGEPG